MENYHEDYTLISKKDHEQNINNMTPILFSGKSFCFSLKNMVLNQIPTQMAKIYIKVKLGKSKIITESVSIMNNASIWNDEVKLYWKNNSSKKASKKLFKIRFSFRFEHISGRGFTRYGNAEINLLQIDSLKDYEFSAKLCDCNYDSQFNCVLSIEPIAMNSLKSKKKNSYDYINSSIISENSENQSQDDLISLKSANGNEISFYIPNICDLNYSNEYDDQKLPILVNQDKLNLLKYQVDGIIMNVLQRKDNIV